MLYRATDWMQLERLAGDAHADVCIVHFASGGTGCFAGDYTRWPHGVGEYNAHCMIVTNNALGATFDTYVVIGSIEVKAGANTDVGTLPEMIQPSEISCNLHVAAPATCILLDFFLKHVTSERFR